MMVVSGILPTADWERLLASWLHDPPDKALSIKDHEARGQRYLAAALGYDSGQRGRARETVSGDVVVSTADRLPVPGYGPEYKWAVSPQGGQLTAIHPLSGEPYSLEVTDVDEAGVESVISSIVKDIEDIRLRYLALWRLLPERLGTLYPFIGRLPADTRVPDHSIWQHMDATAGLSLALADPGGAGFLSFALGPVQPFIAAARSLRDLWAGSAILSWLSFQGLAPVLENLGPTSVVFPALRGMPLMDLWLRREGLDKQVPMPTPEARKMPCVPNRFLAVVPMGREGESARELAEECERRVKQAWAQLSSGCREAFAKCLPERWTSHWSKGWEELWESQNSSFFDVRTAVLPWPDCPEERVAWFMGRETLTFKEAFPGLAAVRALSEAIRAEDRLGYHPRLRPAGYPQDQAGRWQVQLVMSTRLMEAQRDVRHVPAYSPTPDPDGRFAPKCTLMGSFEQIGPATLAESKEFWAEATACVQVAGSRIRDGERFCATSLTKRLALGGGLGDALGLSSRDLRFRDTATLAATDWLRDVGLDPDRFEEWNGQWLHLSGQALSAPDIPEGVAEAIRRARRESSEREGPPAYYAIIALDGDHLGSWLRGDKAPTVADVYEPRIAAFFKELDDTGEGLSARRPVGPALHAAISEALANFAVHVVSAVVERHGGALIYAGGDDVLALVPCRHALACARELEEAYRGFLGGAGNERGFYRVAGQNGSTVGGLLMMGPTATVSAGIALVHYKDDLRASLELARRAERAAKDGGRNAAHIAVARRSGAEASAPAPWQWLETVSLWMKSFLAGASDRWTYRLRGEVPTLKELPAEAVRAEIRRHVSRAEIGTGEVLRRTFNWDVKADPGEMVARQFLDYLELREAHATQAEPPVERPSLGQVFVDFLELVQTASFMARGREAR